MPRSTVQEYFLVRAIKFCMDIGKGSTNTDNVILLFILNKNLQFALVDISTSLNHVKYLY